MGAKLFETDDPSRPIRMPGLFVRWYAPVWLKRARVSMYGHASSILESLSKKTQGAKASCSRNSFLPLIVLVYPGVGSRGSHRAFSSDLLYSALSEPVARVGVLGQPCGAPSR